MIKSNLLHGTNDKKIVFIIIRLIYRSVRHPLLVVKRIYKNLLIKVNLMQNNKNLKRIKNKTSIKVAFFALHSSVWKYDELYKLMENDSLFEPIIVVCPVVNYGRENMLMEMENTYKQFHEKNYNVIKAYNKNENSYIDVKKSISPDIIFYTNPHLLTMKKYYITKHLNCLACYSPYSFHVTHLNRLQYDQLFHNLLWKAFYETETHRQMAEKYARNKGVNVVITGFPGIDPLIRKEICIKNVWKTQEREKKRLIWAPHHSIDDREGLNYSNFLDYFQYMLDLAEQYKEKIQIAFKPHPILKMKLLQHNEWGENRTNEYYDKWANLDNGQLETGEYMDLFNSSDAMIFDSASFMVEYLYCNKPSLFTINDYDIFEKFNIFGKMVFSQHYHGYNKSDIINFLINVVCGENDTKKSEREVFFYDYLIPPDGKTASENILSELHRSFE